MAGLLGAYFGNPNVQRQGARARELAKQRDVNLLADPKTYAVVQGLLGNAPDQLGFSVLNPKYQEIKQVAEPAFYLGSLLQAAPLLAPMTKGLPVGASIKDVGKKSVNVQLNEQSNFLSAKSPFGEVGGTIRQPDAISNTPYLQINYAEVEQANRGSGKGKELYKSLIEEAQNRGLRVFSDSTVEKQAVNVYKSLGKGGYKLKDMTAGSLDDGAVYGAGAQKPAFEISLAQPFQAPQEEAMRLAQQRAALPVEQGGLGLPAGNTPMDRAKAMGFDTPAFHATDVDFESIKPSAKGKLGAGVYVSPSAKYAEKYAGDEARVLPLLTRGNLASDDIAMDIADKTRQEMYSKNPNFSVQEWKQRTTQELLDAGYDGRDMSGLESVIFNPENIRSRFAAFDPFRKTAAIAATMGVAAPNLMAQEVDYTLLPAEKKQELLRSLLGQ